MTENIEKHLFSPTSSLNFINYIVESFKFFGDSKIHTVQRKISLNFI